MVKLFFVGQSGVGKDTIADQLSIPKFALANTLKDLTSIIFNLDRRLFEGKYKDLRIRQVYGLTPRELLIRVAQDGFFDIPALQITYEQSQLVIDNFCLGFNLPRPILASGGIRKTQPGFFIDCLKRVLTYHASYVITDVRTQAEFEAFNECVSIAIYRPIETQKKHKHSSEHLLELQKKCDFEFTNDFESIEKLQQGLSNSEVFLGFVR